MGRLSLWERKICEFDPHHPDHSIWIQMLRARYLYLEVKIMANGFKTGGSAIGYKYQKMTCKHCGKLIGSNCIKIHEDNCWLAPHRYHECKACGKPVKSDGETCSYGCSNTFFRSGRNNPNWKEPEHRSLSVRHRGICFKSHERKCIICGYDRVIDVHHIDGDKKNNSPNNLVPLCRNHHAEIHTLEWGEETKRLLNEIY